MYGGVFVCGGQSKDERMIEELIAEEMELQALSQRQAVTEQQQSQQLRLKQRDKLIDDLVRLAALSLTYFFATMFIRALPLALLQQLFSIRTFGGIFLQSTSVFRGDPLGISVKGFFMGQMTFTLTNQQG